MKNLDKKLERYSALIAGIAVAGGASAQIVYTDVSPDAVINIPAGGGSASYVVDFNADSVNDFAFAMTSGSQPGSIASLSVTYVIYFQGGIGVPYTSNAFIKASSTGTNSVGNLAFGYNIGSSAASWSGGSFGRMAFRQTTWVGAPYSNTFGPYYINADWNSTSDGYVGVRFKIGGSDHYGWIRVNVSPDGSTITIKDFAYDATVDEPIPAGGTVTNVNELDNHVNINMNNNVLYINSVDYDITGGKVSVTNLSGQQVAAFTINSNKEEFGLETLSQGIYMVSVQVQDGVAVEKVYVR